MILPISWMYIRMMGPDGLKDATENAILSANYIAKRLASYYPTFMDLTALLPTSASLTRELSKRVPGSLLTTSQRLIDYGFHAPTMSWPVAGTLMIERLRVNHSASSIASVMP